MKQIVTRKDLAQLFSLADNYINEIGFPKLGHNQYDLFECVRFYIERLQKLHADEIARLKSDKPQDNLARTSAELKQIQIQEKRRELVPAAEVKEAFLALTQIMLANLDALPEKASALLINIGDKKEIKRILSAETNKLKAKIANTKIDAHIENPESGDTGDN